MIGGHIKAKIYGCPLIKHICYSNLHSSGLVVIAIFFAALVLLDATVKPVQEAKADSEKTLAAPRYEIIKIVNGASWTLDRKTGGITCAKCVTNI